MIVRVLPEAESELLSALGAASERTRLPML